MGEKRKNDEKSKVEEPLIDIRLHNLPAGTTIAVFAPKERIEGEVIIIPKSVIECRGIWIGLGWFIKGMAGRNSEFVAEVFYPVTILEPDIIYRHPFAYTLPMSPWSYNGQHIMIGWGIVVKIDIPMSPDFNKTLHFILQPKDSQQIL